MVAPAPAAGRGRQKKSRHFDAARGAVWRDTWSLSTRGWVAMEHHEGKVVALALVTAGLSTSVVLARFGALGVPDGVSHRHAALVGVVAAAVAIGLTGMVLLAVRVIRAAPHGFRLTRRHLM